MCGAAHQPAYPSSIALALSQGKLRTHGWVYDIETGQIDALDGATGRFDVLRSIPTPAP